MPYQSQCKQILAAPEAAQQKYDALQYAELLQKCLMTVLCDSDSELERDADGDSSTFSTSESTSSTTPTPPNLTTTSHKDNSDSLNLLFFFSQNLLEYWNALDAIHDEVSQTCVLAPHIHTIHAPQIHLLEGWKIHWPCLFCYKLQIFPEVFTVLVEKISDHPIFHGASCKEQVWQVTWLLT